jgi:integrase
MPVADLKAGVVRTFMREIETELSGDMCQHILSVLREMSRAAVADELMTSDPTSGLRAAGSERREMNIITPREYERVYAATPEHYRTLVRLLWVTGLRWGEAMGLKADCIIEDVHGRWVVVVKRTLAEVKGQAQLRDHGKTRNAVRNVTIPVDLAEALLEGASDDGWCFRAPRGGFISRANFRRTWLAVCAEAGVSVRVHDLRHSHASLLANSGVNLLVVCKRLGHADLKITSRYLHLIDDGTDPALVVLERIAA